MKVLWVCNLPIAPICKQIGVKSSGGGGWIEGIFNEMNDSTAVDLVICFPYHSKEQVSGLMGKVKYYSFYQDTNVFGMAKPTSVSHKLKKDINRILTIEKPDILHIFGTEFVHSYLFAKQFNNPNKVLISIQGLASKIGERYLEKIPYFYQHAFNISCIARGTLFWQKIKMICRGNNEIKTLLLAKNIIGRTAWDKACCSQINSDINYYYCGEILREPFYTSSKWKFDSCNKHSIFISQGNYPIKGLHIFLRALAIIKNIYPNVIVYVAGSNPIYNNDIIGKIKISTYGLYLKNLINKFNLNDNIVFKGNLSSEDMIKEYLKANVYVLPSIIENSPNSLCEAMLLGVPCVASNVGGVKSLLRDGVDGFLYCYDDYNMLAEEILNIFKSKNNVEDITGNAIQRALQNNHKENNTKLLLEIYGRIK